MILNSSEIKAIEQKEFKLRKNSFSLMQSAGEKCANYISSKVSKNKELLVICGPGNNGGVERRTYTVGGRALDGCGGREIYQL